MFCFAISDFGCRIATAGPPASSRRRGDPLLAKRTTPEMAGVFRVEGWADLSVWQAAFIPPPEAGYNLLKIRRQS